MKHVPARARATNDDLVNLGLLALAGAIVLAGVLRGAGHIAAWISGSPAPAASLAAGLAVLAHPLDPGGPLQSPGLNPFAYWGVCVAGTGGLALVLVRIRRVFGRKTRRRSIEMLPGTAKAKDVRDLASSARVLAAAPHTRPSVPRPRPDEVGYLIGHCHGAEVWLGIESSILIIGPPRSGKGLHLVIPLILSAPGPVVTTSTRPDNLLATIERRSAKGPVAIFDPERLNPGRHAGLKWSLTRGCHDPDVALARAAGLTSSVSFGNVEQGDYWQASATMTMRCLLHAAALDGRDAAELYRWAASPVAAQEALRILQSSSGAADGWAYELDGIINGDPRSRDSQWSGVTLALQCLASPSALDAVRPRPSEELHPEQFLDQASTLYLLATGSGAAAAAPLVAALIEDLNHTARLKAAHLPSGRLDPPLLMALDELANLVPLPSLPSLMSEGGGRGITMAPVLQSQAQARQAWGEHNAGVVWDDASMKVILGGLSNARDLQDIAMLIGERDELTDSVSHDAAGGRSVSRSVRRVPVMGPELVRTIPFGMALIIQREIAPMVTRLTKWTDRDFG